MLLVLLRYRRFLKGNTLLRQAKWKYRNFCIYRTREAYAHSFRLSPLGILGSVATLESPTRARARALEFDQLALCRLWGRASENAGAEF